MVLSSQEIAHFQYIDLQNKQNQKRMLVLYLKKRAFKKIRIDSVIDKKSVYANQLQCYILRSKVHRLYSIQQQLLYNICHDSAKL